MLLKIIILLIPFSLCLADTTQPASRLEELFIWKVSEELKLTVKEEKEFARHIILLNQKKGKSLDEVEVELKKMVFALPQNAQRLLMNYKQALKKYNNISVEEVDTMIKILGHEKAARYFVVKTEISQRIKNLLLPSASSQSIEKKSKVKLPEPKLIEE